MKGLTKNGGYCPCMIEASEDTKCPCKWKREQSLCICELFINEKESKQMRVIKMLAIVALMLTCISLVKYTGIDTWEYVLFLAIGFIASGEK